MTYIAIFCSNNLFWVTYWKQNMSSLKFSFHYKYIERKVVIYVRKRTICVNQQTWQKSNYMCVCVCKDITVCSMMIFHFYVWVGTDHAVFMLVRIEFKLKFPLNFAWVWSRFFLNFWFQTGLLQISFNEFECLNKIYINLNKIIFEWLPN